MRGLSGLLRTFWWRCFTIIIRVIRWAQATCIGWCRDNGWICLLISFHFSSCLGGDHGVGASTPLESVVMGVIVVGFFGCWLCFHLTGVGSPSVSSDTGSAAVAANCAAWVDSIVEDQVARLKHVAVWENCQCGKPVVCLHLQTMTSLLSWLCLSSFSFNHLLFPMSSPPPQVFTCPQCLWSDFHSYSGLTQHQNVLYWDCLPETNADDEAMFTYLYHSHINGTTLDSLYNILMCVSQFVHSNALWQQWQWSSPTLASPKLKPGYRQHPQMVPLHILSQVQLHMASFCWDGKLWMEYQ